MKKGWKTSLSQLEMTVAHDYFILSTEYLGRITEEAKNMVATGRTKMRLFKQ
jgi:hypothetical protein